MRKAKIIFAAALIAMVSSTPAQAEADANTFLKRIDEGDKTFMYMLDAYGYGMSWANTQSRFYCPPAQLVLTPEQTTDLVRRFVERHPSLGTVPAGGALLFALKDAFPCK